jgi:hypothetical protein
MGFTVPGAATPGYIVPGEMDPGLPVALTAPPAPGAGIVFSAGTPYFRWASGDPCFRWAAGTPYLS